MKPNIKIHNIKQENKNIECLFGRNLYPEYIVTIYTMWG